MMIIFYFLSLNCIFSKACLITDTCSCPTQFISSQKYDTAYQENQVFRDFYDKNLTNYELRAPNFSGEKIDGCFREIECPGNETLSIPIGVAMFQTPKKITALCFQNNWVVIIGAHVAVGTLYATCVAYPPPCTCSMTLLDQNNLLDYAPNISSSVLFFPVSLPMVTSDSDSTCQKKISCPDGERLMIVTATGYQSSTDPLTFLCNSNTNSWSLIGTGDIYPSITAVCVNYNPPTCPCSFSRMTSFQWPNLTQYPTYYPDTLYSDDGCLAELRCRGAEQLLIDSGGMREATNTLFKCADFMSNMVWHTSYKGYNVQLTNSLSAVCVNYDSACTCTYRLISNDDYQKAYDESPEFQEFYDANSASLDFAAPMPRWKRGSCFDELTCPESWKLLVSFGDTMSEAPNNKLNTNCRSDGRFTIEMTEGQNTIIRALFATCVLERPKVCSCSLNLIDSSNFVGFAPYLPSFVFNFPFSSPISNPDTCQKRIECEEGSTIVIMNQEGAYMNATFTVDIACNDTAGWEFPTIAPQQFLPNLTFLCVNYNPPTCPCTFSRMTSFQWPNLTQYPTYHPDTLYSDDGCLAELRCRGSEQLLIDSGGMREATNTLFKCADFMGNMVWHTSYKGYNVQLTNSLSAVCVNYAKTCPCQYRLISRDNYQNAYNDDAIFRNFYNSNLTSHIFAAPIPKWTREDGCFGELTCPESWTMLTSSVSNFMVQVPGNKLSPTCSGFAWELEVEGYIIDVPIRILYATCVDYKTLPDDEGFG